MMNEQDKVKLADIVSRFITERMTPEELPVLVGFLTQKKEFKGFQPAEEGHPVLEFQGRYIILITSLDGRTTVRVAYDKAALLPSICFELQFSA